MIDSNADDLNAQDAEVSETAETSVSSATPEPTKDTAKGAAAAKGAEKVPAGDPGSKTTIAGGGDIEAEDKAKEEAAVAAAKPAWPENWREKMAEHYAAGDKKAYAKELTRLQRFTDPTAVYGMGRELEAKFTSGGLVKIPGKDAKPEEIAEYQKALGVPEKPEGYIEHIKLENGAVIGEADKPLLATFSQALHKAGAPPSAVNAAANWYYKMQEEQAAALDEADDTHRRQSERAMKDKYGSTFKRMTNAIPTVFVTAAGGPDLKNPNSVISRLLGGRTADGKLIGNDPDISDWLISMAQEINPSYTVVEDGNPTGMTVDRELEEIEKLRSTDRKKYWSPEVQARERELISAQLKIQSRNRA